jgi:hypothetical protein
MAYRYALPTRDVVMAGVGYEFFWSDEAKPCDSCRRPTHLLEVLSWGRRCSFTCLDAFWISFGLAVKGLPAAYVNYLVDEEID